MTIGGFSSKRLARLRELLERRVDSGFVPGVVAVLARHGEVHVEATGNLAFEGAGSTTPMARDTICRLGSMTKPIVAACAMTLVEDCTLRLDDPVDDLLPELADLTVLADPNGPLDKTVAARRPITLRDLLTYTLGTGMVPAEPGTVCSSGPFGSASTDMSASSGRNSSTGSSRRSVQSSTSVIAQAATIGFVIEPVRQIVSAAIGVLEPAPSKARLPVASMWTSPWRATTATAPGAYPAST